MQNRSIFASSLRPLDPTIGVFLNVNTPDVFLKITPHLLIISLRSFIIKTHTNLAYKQKFWSLFLLHINLTLTNHFPNHEDQADNRGNVQLLFSQKCITVLLPLSFASMAVGSNRPLQLNGPSSLPILIHPTWVAFFGTRKFTAKMRRRFYTNYSSLYILYIYCRS